MAHDSIAAVRIFKNSPGATTGRKDRKHDPPFLFWCPQGKVVNVSDDLPVRAFGALSMTAMTSVRAPVEEMESSEIRGGVPNAVTNLLQLSK